MRCLLGSRFSMNAEVLRWEGIEDSSADTVDQSGHWESYQDPITFEILNRWVADNDADPSTPFDPAKPLRTFSCITRGIVDGGIRVAGTTERFGDTYENIDYVKMWVPASVKLTKRDRITNIRNKAGGTVIWRDEEGDGGATIFNVNGITPLFDAFNRHMENFVLLERAD